MGLIRRMKVKGTVYDVGIYARNLPVMSGATLAENGVKGAVPAPSSSDTFKFLRGDGSFSFPFEITTINLNSTVSIECARFFGCVLNNAGLQNTVSFGITFVGMNESGGISIGNSPGPMSAALWGQINATWGELGSSDSPVSVVSGVSSHSGWNTISITNESSSQLMLLYFAAK